MSTYDVAETDGSLARLVDRVVAGETVTLRRNGKAVARLTPEGGEPIERRSPKGKPAAYSPNESLAMIQRLRIKPTAPQTSAVDIIRRMRDERP